MIERYDVEKDILSPNDKIKLRELNIPIDEFRKELLWSGKSKRNVLIKMLSENK